MAFCFKKKEPVAKAVRRLYCERIDAGLDHLKNRDRPEAAHNVRREIKKVRAILRLVRHEIGVPHYRRTTAALRHATERMTRLRDLQAALGALGDLNRHCDLPSPALFHDIKIDLQKKSRAAEKRLNHSAIAVRRILERLKDAGAVRITSDDWTAIGPGLKKVYRRGRKAYRTVRAEPTPEHFHEWRKRVKDLWHQLRLLRPALSKKWCQVIAGLEDLAGDLGDDHDLEVLKGLAGRAGTSSHTLAGSIVSRQKKLRATAVKAGVRLYAEKPTCFCKELKKQWIGWRGKE